METRVGFKLLPLRGEHSLRVHIRDSNTQISSTGLSIERMSEIRREFRECSQDISKVRKEWERSLGGARRSAVENFPILKAEIDRLRDFGTYLLKTVFPPEAQSKLCGALREIRGQDLEWLLAREEPIGSIDFQAHIERFIPIEYLYFDFDRLPNAWPRNLPELLQILTGFLGFAFNVRRIPSRQELRSPADRVDIPCDATRRLGVKLYRFSDLDHAADECIFLNTSNMHAFDAEICELGSDVAGAISLLNEQLGSPSGSPVQHFICHFIPGSRGGQFLLGSIKYPLEICVNDLVARHRISCSNAWICFLNACESGSAITFDLGGLVPHLFEEYTPACFIGPEHEVPDRFAMEFSRVFYAHWLLHRDLGTALFKTRWFFAKKYNNPTGLFYTYFATKHVRLEGERQHVFL